MNDRSRDIGEFIPAPDDDMIICRCEEQRFMTECSQCRKSDDTCVQVWDCARDRPVQSL